MFKNPLFQLEIKPPQQQIKHYFKSIWCYVYEKNLPTQFAKKFTPYNHPSMTKTLLAAPRDALAQIRRRQTFVLPRWSSLVGFAS
jgi:hypothetical protein